jgi:hypothetical protein
MDNYFFLITNYKQSSLFVKPVSDTDMFCYIVTPSPFSPPQIPKIRRKKTIIQVQPKLAEQSHLQIFVTKKLLLNSKSKQCPVL